MFDRLTMNGGALGLLGAAGFPIRQAQDRFSGDAGMTGMCPLCQADVSSFGPDVSTFRPNVSSFHPNVSTWAGQVSSEEGGGERTSGIDVATRRKGRRNSE